MNESAENYLETILVLSKTMPSVRSIDIVNTLGYKRSSVSVAMKNLRTKEYIVVSPEGFITLTDSGREVAEHVYERHQVLSTFFTSIGVPQEIALEDACKIEHILSQESFLAIKNIVQK